MRTCEECGGDELVCVELGRHWETYECESCGHQQTVEDDDD